LVLGGIEVLGRVRQIGHALRHGGGGRQRDACGAGRHQEGAAIEE
jgi:hypothetical protein